MEEEWRKGSSSRVRRVLQTAIGSMHVEFVRHVGTLRFLHGQYGVRLEKAGRKVVETLHGSAGAIHDQDNEDIDLLEVILEYLLEGAGCRRVKERVGKSSQQQSPSE